MSNDFGLLDTDIDIPNISVASSAEKTTNTPSLDSDAIDSFRTTIVQNTLTDDTSKSDPVSAVFETMNTALNGNVENFATDVMSAVHDIAWFAQEQEDPKISELVDDIQDEVDAVADRYGGFDLHVPSDNRSRAINMQKALRERIYAIEQEYNSIGEASDDTKLTSGPDRDMPVE